MQQQAEEEAPQDMLAVAAAAESSAIVSSSDADQDRPVASTSSGGSAAGLGRGAASAAASAYDSSDDEMGHPGGGGGNGGDPLPDPHYDEHQDEEDEAWVYRHMRGGRAEEVMMAVQSTHGKAREDDPETTKAGGGGGGGGGGEGTEMMDATDSKEQPQRAPAQDRAGARSAPPNMSKVMMLKPRNSDAVLSCPCCFTIVCMDCQRHVKYTNQYRAMFVMHIGVAWHKRLRWDDSLGELVEIIGANDTSDGARERTMELDSPGSASASGVSIGGGKKNSMSSAVPGDSCDEGQPCDSADLKTKSTSAGNTSRTSAHLDGEDEIYYSVYCASCNTEVAYLNMEDEVYHFVNCLASG